jgi:heptosyltransferase III
MLARFASPPRGLKSSLICYWRMRILFVTANRLGDAVLSTGLLDYLIRTFPSARITVACGPVAEGVFKRMPNLERIVVFSKQALGGHWLKLWSRTVTQRWDLVIDIRGSALCWLLSTRRRAVMHKASGHKITQLARVLRLDAAPLPIAWFSAQDIARAHDLLPAGGRPVIVLAPTANWAPKIWPAERFVALFHRLAATHIPDAAAAIIAGPGEGEAAMANPILQALPRAINLVGNLDLPEVAAFLARADLFVGNDSGLMHLAASSGAPTLGLFGPTDASVYGPAGRRAAAVTGSDATMASISLDAVEGVAAALMAL